MSDLDPREAKQATAILGDLAAVEFAQATAKQRLYGWSTTVSALVR